MSAVLKTEDLPHYTYTDYKTWQGRWEIIYGVPYAMSPQPSFRHQRISQRIAKVLGLALEKNKNLTPLLPIDWEITEDTIVNPDHVIVRGRPEGVKLTEPPVLAIEILSPSTATKDRNLKFRLYQSAGLPYYIIVEPEKEQAEVYALENSLFQLKLSTRKDTYEFVADSEKFSICFATIWDT